MATSPEWIAGTDSGPIDCLHQGPIDGNVINTYCWIMGTSSCFYYNFFYSYTYFNWRIW